jgi:NAD(P)-dependent dehydrogenase (short-subunit alcohol dehydrogenase family)
MLALAKHNPAHIYFTGRNTKRGQALIEKIKKDVSTANLTFLECDFESLDSIRVGMKAFTHSSLDILMCNAGISMSIPFS